MIFLPNLVFWSGLDLNVESQTYGLLRYYVKDGHAPRQSRVLSTHGYLDFPRLYAIQKAQGFFVTRAKSNTQFRRRYSNPVDRSSTNVVCDQVGILTVFYSSKAYPAALRRVVVKDEAGKRIAFLTNNLALKTELIADLYLQRSQVELFFQWIKQHLRIKAALGTSENAVKTQIGIAVYTYMLIAIVKKRLHFPHSLYEILQILSLSLSLSLSIFETSPKNQLLTSPSTD
jgi:IS4 transposase